MPSPCAALRSVPVRRLQNGVWTHTEDTVGPEIVIEADWTLEGAPAGHCRLWAWPEDLESLALGHVLLDLAHPGMRSSNPDALCGLRHGGQVRARDPRSFCVELTALADVSRATPPALPGTDLLEIMAEFMSAPGNWDDTGCFHRLGMYDVADRRLVRRAEDIGRHNCLDRLVGFAVRSGLDPAGHALLLSSRITASLYMKARRAGFSVLVSRAAVSGTAVELARTQNVTLVGFAREREGRLTVFADDAGRVTL